jgi:hypothetical protein
MPDESSLRTVRAAVETIAPQVDGRPGAVDLGVDVHVSSLVDMAIRDVIDGLMVFTYGGLYSEWSTFDRATRQLRTRLGSWGPMGYHGPAEGHPDYRRDA